MNTIPKILPLLGLDGISLKHGMHDSRQDGVCALEAVAWIAGEPHSDHPKCACPVLSDFLRKWNDDLPNDADRNPLCLNWTNLQLIARIANDENSDNWPGTKIVLYDDPNVSFGGKIVGGIRVRAPKTNDKTPVKAAPVMEEEDEESIPF